MSVKKNKKNIKDKTPAEKSNFGFAIAFLILATVLCAVGIFQDIRYKQYLEDYKSKVDKNSSWNLTQQGDISDLDIQVANIKRLINIKECDLGFAVGYPENEAYYYWREDIPLDENQDFDYMRTYCYQAVQASRCGFCQLIYAKYGYPE